MACQSVTRCVVMTVCCSSVPHTNMETVESAQTNSSLPKKCLHCDLYCHCTNGQLFLQQGRKTFRLFTIELCDFDLVLVVSEDIKISVAPKS